MGVSPPDWYSFTYPNMKHLSQDELKAFFKGRLDGSIDTIAADPEALGLFVCKQTKSGKYTLVAVGNGYPCADPYELILEAQESGVELVASTKLPRRERMQATPTTTDQPADSETNNAAEILNLTNEREKELKAWEERLQRQDASLKRREKELLASEEELQRFAEQQMEDIAREEMM